MSFFTKIAQNPVGFFKKTVRPMGEGIFRKTSKTLGTVGQGLGVVGRESRRFAQNPVTRGIGEFALGKDKTNQILDTTLRGSQALRGAGNLLQQGSDITNPANLRGNASQVAGNLLERSKKLKGDAGAYFV